MIHVLTRNPACRQLLTTLLNEADREHAFHYSVEPLLKAVRKLGKSDQVFYDLQLEDVLWAFERLYKACKRTHLVAFEPLTKEVSLEHNQCPVGVDHYLLLPPNPERARSRLQALFRELAQKTAAGRKKQSAKRPGRSAEPKHPRAVAAAPQPDAAPATPEDTAGNESTPLIARYLQARSPAMRTLLSDIEPALASDRILLIEGEEGAEMELLAREINFRANGDARPLTVVNSTNPELEPLRRRLSEGGDAENPEFVYLGQTVDWTSSVAEQMESFIAALEASENPPLRLIVGHSDDSEAYLPERLLPLCKALLRKAHRIRIPAMSERAQDIPMIAHSIFSTLRMAHPFLRTRVLGAEAVRFLVSEADRMDYARLARVIRNAMALSRQDSLTAETLRNLSDDTPMTQHLIESLADERYFKTGSDDSPLPKTRDLRVEN